MNGIEISGNDLEQKKAMDDECTFREIYNLYWDKLYRVAYNKIRSSENAKEIVQDIFLDLWNRRSTLKINDIEAYLFSAVKYQVLDFIKKEIIRRRYRESILPAQEIDVNNTLNELVCVELSQSIVSAIDSMPEKTRVIFESNRILFKSTEQIATEFGIPTRTVEYHITQGLKLLRLHLKDYLPALATIFSGFLQ